MSLHLDIPDHCYDAKPFYRTRSDADAVRREIKAHIKGTGMPHTWRHHTHSKPVTGSRIVYIGTFDLPTSHQAADRHAPCPCCSPTAPKYANKGKIAWFPDEHVIRMIGPDCFKTLNPEGHWEALADFNREEAERQTISYLISNLHLSSDALDVLEDAEAALVAIDEVHGTLQKRLTELLRIDLWKHVGRGKLEVYAEGRRLHRARDGSEEVQTFMDIQQLFEFPGYKMFSPKTSRLCSRAKTCSTRLSLIEFGKETEERVRAMTNEERAKAARMLSQGLNTIRGILKDAEAIRSGFLPLSISNLKGWTRHSGCPVSIHISGDHENFYIGLSEFQQMRIEIPSAFWRNFSELPQIATIASWDPDDD